MQRMTRKGLRFHTASLAGKIAVGLTLAGTYSAWAQQVPQAHRIISHIVSGGGWKTIITLVNTGLAPISVTLQFRNDRGVPLDLPLALEEDIFFTERVGSQLTVSLAPYATGVVESEGPANSPTLLGWADLTVPNPVTLTGSVRFRHMDEDGSVSESSLAIGTASLPGLIMPFDNSDGYTTGVSFVNPNSAFTTVKVIVRDFLGILLDTRLYGVAANGHVVFDLGSDFVQAAHNRGFIEFQTLDRIPITGIGLRFAPSGHFTTLPTTAIAAR